MYERTNSNSSGVTPQDLMYAVPMGTHIQTQKHQAGPLVPPDLNAYTYADPCTHIHVQRSPS